MANETSSRLSDSVMRHGRDDAVRGRADEVDDAPTKQTSSRIPKIWTKRKKKGKAASDDTTRDAAVIFDVDGTLVDSNDAHARAWVDAFAEHGITVAYEPVRRAIGMGGDKLMPLVAGIEEDTPKGKEIANRRKQIFKQVCGCRR